MMIDLTSLLLIAGLFLGAVVGDAALFGDPLQVQITVPTKLTDRGFTEEAAEEVFAAEVARIGKAISIVQTPKVQIRSRPTILAAIAKPMNLDHVVVALQSRVGIDVMTVNGAVMTGPKDPQLEMVIVVTVPNELPVQIRLAQDDGDAMKLIQHGAGLALERVAPYRVALTDFAKGIGGDAASLTDARKAAQRALGQPWVPERASERLMLHNLLALLAMIDGDTKTADVQFGLTDQIPMALPPAHGTVSLNRAFIAVGNRQPAEAERWLALGKEQTATVDLPGWQARLDLLDALVAWSRGNMKEAEALLRDAIARSPFDEGPHYYLGRLLASKGDVEGAAAEQVTALHVRSFETEIPALAPSVFRVDPVKGGLQRRF